MNYVYRNYSRFLLRSCTLGSPQRLAFDSSRSDSTRSIWKEIQKHSRRTVLRDHSGTFRKANLRRFDMPIDRSSVVRITFGIDLLFTMLRPGVRHARFALSFGLECSGNWEIDEVRSYSENSSFTGKIKKWNPELVSLEFWFVPDERVECNRVTLWAKYAGVFF